MASPLPATVVIACPKCGTRYQLPAGAIGPKGRKVACAHCSETWEAHAEDPPTRDPDTLFDPEAEAALDAAFAEAEAAAASARPQAEAPPARSLEEIKAAIAPKSDAAAPAPKRDSADDAKRQKEFRKRQDAIYRRLPLAKIRRVMRIGGVSMLLALIALGVVFRAEIVKRFPDLAGAYAALGLGVNVVGLEFRDVKTLTGLRNGTNVLQVDARIYSVAARNVIVPPVVVTLLDDTGASLYEWSVLPEAHDLEPGEVVDFATQLSSPPAAATRVRLTFNDGKARAESPVATAAPGA